MRDNVANRRRMRFTSKLRTAALVLRENGPVWCLELLTYYAASMLADRAYTAMDRRRRSLRLPGLNSASLNREIWNAWDWGVGGEEWTQSPQWKQSLLSCVLERWVAAGSRILEIGPGSGRWTAHLLPRARDYVGIDISSACIEKCASLFRDNSHARFIVGSGSDLSGVADTSIDVIWSFDVFVHINRREIDAYAREFARVLKPGALAVIHHGTVGGSAGGWRSDLTNEALGEILGSLGLEVESSISQWNDGNQIHELSFEDRITIIRKPDVGMGQ